MNESSDEKLAQRGELDEGKKKLTHSRCGGLGGLRLHLLEDGVDGMRLLLLLDLLRVGGYRRQLSLGFLRPAVPLLVAVLLLAGRSRAL